jgi:hypothetical protein
MPTRSTPQGREGIPATIGVARRAARAIASLGPLLALLTAAPAHGLEPDPFSICTKQRYALCAAASCLVYNEVAYCQCDVEFGKSISAADTIEEGDICDVNRAGYGNGYMMSTYSLPISVISGGKEAIYTCPSATSDGAYAQCDGGFCFASTRGRRFPGFDRKLKANEIICSCPITVADPSMDPIGYQFIGPYPCQQSYFDNCRRETANKRTGSHIVVGAPTGLPRLLTEKLNGSVPPLNHCEPVP